MSKRIAKTMTKTGSESYYKNYFSNIKKIKFIKSIYRRIHLRICYSRKHNLPIESKWLKDIHSCYEYVISLPNAPKEIDNKANLVLIDKELGFVTNNVMWISTKERVRRSVSKILIENTNTKKLLTNNIINLTYLNDIKCHTSENKVIKLLYNNYFKLKRLNKLGDTLKDKGFVYYYIYIKSLDNFPTESDVVTTKSGHLRLKKYLCPIDRNKPMDIGNLYWSDVFGK